MIVAESLSGISDEERQAWTEEDPDLAVADDDGAEEMVSLEEMVARVIVGMQYYAVAVKNSGLYPANSAIRQE